MNLDLYLHKLGLSAQKLSLAFLNEIISAHQKVISFNNLAVFFRPGEILNLELEALFEKVVAQGEGGYCFENNKVFYYLLEGLGFKVTAKSARVLYNQTGDIARTHRITIITINGERFLADVGFGRDAPPRAIAIDSKESSGHHILKENEQYYLLLPKDEALLTLYSFDDGHYQESDFTLANYYTNTHPNSKFVQDLVVTRRDQGLVEIINGPTYSRIENGVRQDFEIKDQERFQSYLKNFGIERVYDFSLLEKR